MHPGIQPGPAWRRPTCDILHHICKFNEMRYSALTLRKFCVVFDLLKYSFYFCMIFFKNISTVFYLSTISAVSFFFFSLWMKKAHLVSREPITVFFKVHMGHKYFVPHWHFLIHKQNPFHSFSGQPWSHSFINGWNSLPSSAPFIDEQFTIIPVLQYNKILKGKWQPSSASPWAMSICCSEQQDQ